MHNARTLSPEAQRLFTRSVERVTPRLAPLPSTDRLLFLLRLERWFEDLLEGLVPVYGAHPAFGDFVDRLVERLADGFVTRPDDLKSLDLERDLTPDWFQRPSMLGYVFYVDRFAGTLQGVQAHLPYLEELGATYVHLMSTLRARAGENDGGFAIDDYHEVDPRVGTREDLRATCTMLRERGMSTCIDLVLNHCADTHPWAEAARRGDPRYRAYFHTFASRDEPDAYERTLPEIFPHAAPGNFSYDTQMNAWVWTTFHTYQWDLDWSNPEVFLEIVDVMLDLANLGVDVFRLDAVAFMWKRKGTVCQNEPEVFALLQALRATSRIATPAVLHKAEAIVGPDDLIKYFGTGTRFGKVADLAYHNNLMVHVWSALASRDVRLMNHTLKAFPIPPASTSWATYVRCHDDIGWAVTDEDASAVGLDGRAHRAFLTDYYVGVFPGSDARGAVFGTNPRTGDRRVSGTLASLAGLEAAIAVGDAPAVTLAVDRIVLAHAIILSFGGIPLLYMGDELGLQNDASYLDEPAHAADSRWMHRPPMDWQAAARRSDPGSVEGRIFQALRRLVEARRGLPQLHASYAPAVAEVGSTHVFAFLRSHPQGAMLALFNVTEEVQRVAAAEVASRVGFEPTDAITSLRVQMTEHGLELEPYGFRWLLA